MAKKTFSFTENNITFSNITTPGLVMTAYPISAGNYNNIISNKKLINAVDIDWNGAILGNNVINSTSDLLSYISNTSCVKHSLKVNQNNKIGLNDETVLGTMTINGVNVDIKTKLSDEIIDMLTSLKNNIVGVPVSIKSNFDINVFCNTTESKQTIYGNNFTLHVNDGLDIRITKTGTNLINILKTISIKCNGIDIYNKCNIEFIDFNNLSIKLSKNLALICLGGKIEICIDK